MGDFCCRRFEFVLTVLADTVDLLSVLDRIHYSLGIRLPRQNRRQVRRSCKAKA